MTQCPNARHHHHHPRHVCAGALHADPQSLWQRVATLLQLLMIGQPDSEILETFRDLPELPTGRRPSCLGGPTEGASAGGQLADGTAASLRAATAGAAASAAATDLWLPPVSGAAATAYFPDAGDAGSSPQGDGSTSYGAEKEDDDGSSSSSPATFHITPTFAGGTRSPRFTASGGGGGALGRSDTAMPVALCQAAGEWRAVRSTAGWGSAAGRGQISFGREDEREGEEAQLVDPQRLEQLLDSMRDAGRRTSGSELVHAARRSSAALEGSPAAASASGDGDGGYSLAGLLAHVPSAAGLGVGVAGLDGQGAGGLPWATRSGGGGGGRGEPPATVVEGLVAVAEGTTVFHGPASPSCAGASIFQGSAGASSGSGGAGMRVPAAVGLLGERYVCEALTATLPGFSAEACWASGYRVAVGLPMPDAEPPYDFVYHDVGGDLCEEAGTLCLIEVKATSSADPATPFFLTNNEWAAAKAVDEAAGSGALAQRLLSRWAGGQESAPPDKLAYVVLRVCGIDLSGKGAGSPAIGCMLVNPVAALRKGRLDIQGADGLLVSNFM